MIFKHKRSLHVKLFCASEVISHPLKHASIPKEFINDAEKSGFTGKLDEFKLYLIMH